eukprot:CAMPEP_0204113908 /NCGR_PEP_ID=MMETSP0361-20130328/3932_1 /ASSEMBLY_ACC=CAM_ASM_000343 /TAXON_ID=268821 /ORGANISM="Scrippsiella Hangoei, Strain SHTV-5" /LENGTH=53 /DNA_ID=CAMNT_0051064343 /DNA_START=185 /DNA_END=346 /DNA_ORIENTATION=-
MTMQSPQVAAAPKPRGKPATEPTAHKPPVASTEAWAKARTHLMVATSPFQRAF